MCWRNDAFSIGFEPVDGAVEVVIDIDFELYKSLPLKVQALFSKTPAGYSYRHMKAQPNKSIVCDDQEPCPDDQKLVGEGMPTPISTTELAQIIKNQKVIFYTGAGISAGCVPVMANLEKELGLTDLEKTRNYRDFLVRFFEQIEHHIKTMEAFFCTCEYAGPSVAHKALAQIAMQYKHPLFTENIDQLHQKTGLTPVVMPGRQKESLAKIVKAADYIVTIGLSTDDGGFLKYCKEVNPSICIVSINLEKVCYLSGSDFTLIGDIQEIVPQLKTLVLE
jgi:NAD-dependent SIR2 family protein deacetylase